MQHPGSDFTGFIGKTVIHQAVNNQSGGKSPDRSLPVGRSPGNGVVVNFTVIFAVGTHTGGRKKFVFVHHFFSQRCRLLRSGAFCPQWIKTCPIFKLQSDIPGYELPPRNFVINITVDGIEKFIFFIVITLLDKSFQEL